MRQDQTLGVLTSLMLLGATVPALAQNVVHVTRDAPKTTEGAPKQAAGTPNAAARAEVVAESAAVPSAAGAPPESEPPSASPASEPAAAELDDAQLTTKPEPTATKPEPVAGPHVRWLASDRKHEAARDRYVAPGDETDAPDVDPNSVPFTHHQVNLSAQLGFQINWLTSSTVDAFADKDAVVGPLARIGIAPWASGRFSLAFTPEWSFASTSALARSSATRLGMHRLSLGFEGRYHFHHRYHAYLRVSPGAVVARASLTDAAGAELVDENWAFRLDGTVGLAARLASNSDGTQTGFRLLAYVEGGFDWTASSELRLEATGSRPARVSPLDLGPLDLSSPHAGAGLMLTY